MRVAQTYDDYMKGKSACEDVISWAELFGRWLFQKKMSSGTVLTVLPGESTVDYYLYAFSPSGKLLLKSWKNSFSNGLSASLELGLYADPAVRQWWDQVLFSEGNGIYYDRYYDNLRIAESSDQLFSGFLERIKTELAKIPISKAKQVFFPKCLVEHKPLLYVLQSEYNVRVCTIPELSVDSSLDESFPGFDNSRQAVLNAGGGIPVDFLFKHGLTIRVPNHSSTLDSPALPGVNWGMITAGNSNRYSSGGIEYFETMINAESDLFGNVFLNVYEFDKRIKCLKCYE